MAEFEVFELRGGWIQELGRIYFKKYPAIGESVEIPGSLPEQVRRYEVLELELTTGSTIAGNIVLTPIDPETEEPSPIR